MGFMVGRMGIGATLEGPLFQVDRFEACGRVLATGISPTVEVWTGEGLGAMFSLPAGNAATTALSVFPMRDFLNHEGFEVDVDVVSVDSFDPR
jgi:hypothetical protein